MALPFPLPAAGRDSPEGLALGDASGERWFRLFRAPEEAAALAAASRGGEGLG